MCKPISKIGQTLRLIIVDVGARIVLFTLWTTRPFHFFVLSPFSTNVITADDQMVTLFTSTHYYLPIQKFSYPRLINVTWASALFRYQLSTVKRKSFTVYFVNIPNRTVGFIFSLIAKFSFKWICWILMFLFILR